jgi:catechol 2,3-dioxygenase-like lactoylglutathione lyase family enzyme
MKFVSNMDDAVTFYRDTLGLPLKFQSPGWSEFATGSTVLALHPSSERNPPGKVELGFSVDDLKAFHGDMAAKGVKFPIAAQGTGLRLTGAVPRLGGIGLQRIARTDMTCPYERKKDRI